MVRDKANSCNHSGYHPSLKERSTKVIGSPSPRPFHAQGSSEANHVRCGKVHHDLSSIELQQSLIRIPLRGYKMGDVHAAVKRSQQVNGWFFIGVATMMILLNAVAFGPSLLNTSSRNVPLPLTPLVTAHAVVSVAWLLLFLAQATLAATARTSIHRRLGSWGAVLTVAFIVIGVVTVFAQAKRGSDLSGDLLRLPPQPGASDPAAIQLSQLFFFLTFGILAGAAFYFRRRPDLHKRFMLLAIMGGLTPTPIAHIIGHWSVLYPWTGMIFSGSLLLFLSIGPIYDRLSEGRVHLVSLVGGILVFVSNAVFNLAIVPSTTWREVAKWMVK
jgi:hypothetical protein